MRNFAKVIAAGATVLLLAGVSTAAHADPVNVNVVPGSLTATVDPLEAFETQINVVGSTTLKQNMTVRVEDATGQNAGWTVSQSVTDMMYWGGGAGYLDPSAFRVGSLVNMSQVLDPGEAPSGAPAFTGGAGDLGVGQTILQAESGASTGAFTVVAELEVQIPRNAEAGTYSGTLNTNIVQGTF